MYHAIACLTGPKLSYSEVSQAWSLHVGFSLEPQFFARQIPLKIGKEDRPEEEQKFDQPTQSLNVVNPMAFA